jgi:hypothetical protein
MKNKWILLTVLTAVILTMILLLNLAFLEQSRVAETLIGYFKSWVAPGEELTQETSVTVETQVTQATQETLSPELAD